MADPRRTDPRSDHDPHRSGLPPKEPPTERARQTGEDAPRADEPPRPLSAADIDAGELRKRIDSGETGEKVPYADPAAAPLQTDSESGGHPLRGVSRYGPADQGVTGADDAARHARGTAPKGRFATTTIVWILVALALIALLAVSFIEF